MARIAAQENMLYYPTPVSQIEKFARIFKSHDRNIRMVDFCCGEGLALKALADFWQVRSRLVGVELDKFRAKNAESVLDDVLACAFENVTLVGGKINLIFANPPYDNRDGERVEIGWIERMADMLERDQYMVLVLPNHYFNGSQWEKKLLLTMYHKHLSLFETGYEDPVGVIPFDDDEYPAFKQGFLVLKKTWSKKLLQEMPVMKNLDEYNKTHYLSWSSYQDKEDPQFKIEDVVYESLITPDNYHLVFGESAHDVPTRPLQEMSTEIVAVAIAGGMFSGIEIDDRIVRGGTRTVTSTYEVVTDTGTEKHEAMELVAFVSMLDAKDGTLVQHPSDTEEFGIQIEKLSGLIADKLKKDNPPLYNPSFLDLYRDDLMELHSPRNIGEDDGLLLPQLEKAATLMHGYKFGLHSSVLIGEMGVGKTLTSLAVAWASVKHRPSHLQKIVVLLPPKADLVEKWGAEEIDMAFSDIPHTTIEITSITDAQKAFATDGLVFVLIRETMAKRTSGWEYLPETHDIRGNERCHNCGDVYKPLNKFGNEPKRLNEFTYCSECGTKLFQFSRTGKVAKKDTIETVEEYVDRWYPSDMEPEERLKVIEIVREHFKINPKASMSFKGRAYASVANYIKDHYHARYFLIVDEAHQYKGGDTARGYASAALMSACWRSLIMTGTLYNGYASSLFYTLYRSQYLFRNDWGYDEQQRFVSFFGLQEKITKEKDSVGSYSGYSKSITRVEEIPGIHPNMVTMMLGYVSFMKLAEFGKCIPEQESFTLFIEPDKKAESDIRKYLTEIKNRAVEEMRDETMRSMSLISQLTWANSGVWDTYPMGDHVESSVSGEIFTLPESKVYMTAKEEAILRLVQGEKRKGYPTLIFYGQFDRRPLQNRLIPLFKDYGMKLVAMPASVKSRKPFILQALENGADAIICNANLVREGIDLLMFRNIIWAQPTTDSILVSQANQRNHRLGQTEKTKVYYIGYQGTYQAEQWTRTAEKVQAMATMHGDVRTGLAALLGTANLVTQVQQTMIDYDDYASDLTLDDIPALVLPEENATIAEEEPKSIEVDFRPRGWEDATQDMFVQVSLF